MGENVIDLRAQEILARFTGDLQGLLQQLQAENLRLRLQLLEQETLHEQERQARRRAEQELVEYRRLSQKYYVQAHREELSKGWDDFDPATYTVTSKEIHALIDNLPEQQ